MMKLGVVIVAMCIASPAVAQQAATVAQQASKPALPAGTVINLVTVDSLTTKGKKLLIGHRFNLQTKDDISAGGIVLIPRGTPATAEVTEVRNKGMWGKSGRIAARILYLTLNGRQVRMSGVFDDKGTTGTAGVVSAIAVLPVAGFLVTGTSATIPSGRVISGFLDEDMNSPPPKP